MGKIITFFIFLFSFVIVTGCLTNSDNENSLYPTTSTTTTSTSTTTATTIGQGSIVFPANTAVAAIKEGTPRAGVNFQLLRVYINGQFFGFPQFTGTFQFNGVPVATEYIMEIKNSNDVLLLKSLESSSNQTITAQSTAMALILENARKSYPAAKSSQINATLTETIQFIRAVELALADGTLVSRPEAFAGKSIFFGSDLLTAMGQATTATLKGLGFTTSSSTTTSTSTTTTTTTTTTTSTTGSGDTTPPTLKNALPADGNFDIDPGTFITLQFSEAINPLSVDLLSFQLRDPLSTVLTGVFSINGPQIVFSPAKPLTNGLHTLSLTTAIKDLAGNSIASSSSLSFTVKSPGKLIRDIYPGANSAFVASQTLHWHNGFLYFGANNGTLGGELWRSDGTYNGTTLFKDINPGIASSTPGPFASLNGWLYFFARTASQGLELWKSDGTAPNTAIVKDIATGTFAGINPTSFLVANSNRLFFVGRSSLATGYELWSSDGTAIGTQLILDASLGALDSTFGEGAIFNNSLFYLCNKVGDGRGAELWKSDGTATGTALFKDINPGIAPSLPSRFKVVGNKLYFGAYTAVSGYEPYVSDGTTGGTLLLKDINPGANNSLPNGWATLAGRVYFGADDGVSGAELWSTDGTTANTARMLDLIPGSGGSNPAFFLATGNLLFFRATNAGYGTEIFKSNGTAEKTYVAFDIAPGSASANPALMTVVGNRVYLLANDGVTGLELYYVE